MFHVIAACDAENGIGLHGVIPWHISEDLKHFKACTANSVVVMGRKTYESIGKPLPGRINLVISKSVPAIPSVIVFTTPERCVEYCLTSAECADKKLFVIGGAEIYKWFYENKLVASAYITRINYKFNCDTFIVNYQAYGVERVELLNEYRIKENYKVVTGVKDLAEITEEEKIFITADVADITADVADAITNSVVDTKDIIASNTALSSAVNDTVSSSPIIIKPTIANDVSVTVEHYIYGNADEHLQLCLMRGILNYGIESDDRTGTGTISTFGNQLKFDLSQHTFPLMTTRKLFFRGIFEELMLFIRGQTNSKILEEKNINIWAANTSREFLDSRGLKQLPVGDMGHSYGFSFRHFGGKYTDCNADYTGVGYDQLAALIKEIKTNPSSRRLRISLWEPNAAHMSALPPCLEQYQFYVRNGKISCMMTQRSSDQVIAGGWNVATGALLTILIAHVCQLEPAELIWNIGDAHIYKNLIAGLKEQLSRTPYMYPKLYLRNASAVTNIEDFQFEHMNLVRYQHWDSIHFNMSV